MGSMVYQVQLALQSQLRIGESRHDAKRAEGTHAPEGIFSYGTFETYLKQACAFVKWAKEVYGCNTLEKAWFYVEAYLQRGIDAGLSPATLSTQRAALCKLYHCGADDLCIRLPPRNRGAITRSRNAVARDIGFSTIANADIIAFAQATGLRRHELAAVKSVQIHKRDEKLQIVDVIGKGGKVRNVDVLPGRHEAVFPYADLLGRKRIFDHIPSHMDVHGYRREYAQELYALVARPPDTLSSSEKYFCRNDKAGTVYDRQAMLYVSRQLGHTRISVVAGHYL